MKRFLGLTAMLVSTATGVAHAVVLHDQPLPIWEAGWPCQLNSRAFASFQLEHDSIIQAGTFAVYGFVGFGPAVEQSILTFSVWDEPYGNELHSVTVEKGDYDPHPSIPNSFWATFQFPNWPLQSGRYWISIIRENGLLAWATDRSVGDDRHYFGPNQLNHPATYVGYSLSGTIVPEPSTAALLMLAGLFARRRRR